MARISENAREIFISSDKEKSSSFGFNLFVSAGMQYYSTNSKYKKREYTIGDLEEINRMLEFTEDDTGLSLEGKGGHLFINEKLPYSYNKLPPDVYHIRRQNYEDRIYPIKLNDFEELLDLQVDRAIIEDFNKFNSKKERELTKRLKLIHKRGVLLYGPPGSGKTTTIHKIINQCKPKNSLVFFCDGNIPADILQNLKQDKRLKIFVFEELAEIVEHCSKATLLNFLDGENSLDNSFVLAATNYPEKLPSNFVERAGRFDTHYRLAYLCQEDIKTYYKKFFDKEISEQDLKLLKKVTISSLKEIFLICLRYSMNIEEAYKKIEKQKEFAKNEFAKAVKIGFTNTNEEY